MGYCIRFVVIGLAFRAMVRRISALCLLFRATERHVLGITGIGQSARFSDMPSRGPILSRSSPSPLFPYTATLLAYHHLASSKFAIKSSPSCSVDSPVEHSPWNFNKSWSPDRLRMLSSSFASKETSGCAISCCVTLRTAFEKNLESYFAAHTTWHTMRHTQNARSHDKLLYWVYPYTVIFSVCQGLNSDLPGPLFYPIREGWSRG
jgi:hypothetical protein